MASKSTVSLIVQLVDKATKGLNNITTGLLSLKETAEEIRRVSYDVTAAGVAITTAGYAAAQAFMIPVREAANLEKVMSDVLAITGATKEQFVGLNAVAQELGRTTRYTAQQAAAGMRFMAFAGFKATEIMAAMPDVLNLAAAANLDLAEAADITTNILKGYGKTTSELGQANDVLVKTFTSANTNLTQLGQAMKYVAPVAKTAGMAFEETSAIIGLLGNAGIQATMAGTSLRRVITGLLKPTRQAQNILDKLNVSVSDSSGKMLPMVDIVGQLEEAFAALGSEAKKTAYLTTIFGVRGLPGMATLLTEGSEALKDFTEELKNSRGITKEIAEIQLQNLIGQLTILKSALSGLAIEIAGPLLKTLASMATWFAKLVNDVTNFLKSLGPVGPILLTLVGIFGAVTIGIGAFIAAIGALGIAISGVVLGFAQINKMLGAYTARQVAAQLATTGTIGAMGRLKATLQTVNPVVGYTVLKLGKLARALVAVGVTVGAWKLTRWTLESTKWGQSIERFVTSRFIDLHQWIAKTRLELAQWQKMITFRKHKVEELDKFIESQKEYIESVEQGREATLSAIGSEDKRRLSLLELLKTRKDNLFVAKDEVKGAKQQIQLSKKNIEEYKGLIEEYRAMREEKKKFIKDRNKLIAFNKETIAQEKIYAKAVEEAEAKVAEAERNKVELIKKTYKDIIEAAEEGSEVFLAVKKAELDKIKSTNDILREYEKIKLDKGLTDYKQYYDTQIQRLRDYTAQVIELKEIELEKLKEYPEENLEKILKIENEIIQIRREAGLEVIKLKREQTQALEAEDKKAFDSWKALEDIKLGLQESNLNLQLTKLREAYEQGKITEEEYLNEQYDLNKKFYQDKITLAAETADKIAELQGEDSADFQKALADKLKAEGEYKNFTVQAEGEIARAKKNSTDETKKAKDEQEELTEAQITNFQAIAEGIVAYRGLSEKARELGGIGGDLVEVFEKFKDRLSLGELEANALKVAMSGTAEEMLELAKTMEDNAEVVDSYGVGLDIFARRQEAARASQLLRTEASRLQAEADRKAAAALSELSAEVKKYLDIALSAQDAITNFTSKIEDLTFALENDLIPQSKFNNAVQEMLGEIAKVIPKGTDLYQAIEQLTKSLLAGSLSIEDFTSALREMAGPGARVRDIMDELADTLAGHSVTTAADEASNSIGNLTNMFLNSARVASGFVKEIGEVTKGIKGLAGGNVNFNGFGQNLVGALSRQMTNVVGEVDKSLALSMGNIGVGTVENMAGDAKMKIDIEANIHDSYDIDSAKRIVQNVLGEVLDEYFVMKGRFKPA